MHERVLSVLRHQHAFEQVTVSVGTAITQQRTDVVAHPHGRGVGLQVVEAEKVDDVRPDEISIVAHAEKLADHLHRQREREVVDDVETLSLEDRVDRMMPAGSRLRDRLERPAVPA